MSKQHDLCYNCGQIIEGNITREHIPAKTLFEGYSEEYKVNRITVPSCFRCNNSTSGIDEEFRNLVGIVTNDSQNSGLSKKSVKSLKRKSDFFERIYTDVNNQVRGVTFNEGDINRYHQKVMRGLFYYQYGYPLPQDYEVLIDWNRGNIELSMAKNIIGYLEHNYQWQHSGHPEIFRYILQPFREDPTPPSTGYSPKADDTFLAILSYNGTHAAIAIAVKKEVLK